MKKVKQLNKKGFFKTKFIQFCRLLGYEIIDQNSFEVPTLSKNLNESLGIQGEKSISIPYYYDKVLIKGENVMKISAKGMGWIATAAHTVENRIIIFSIFLSSEISRSSIP